MLLKRFQKLLIVVFKTLFKTQYSRQITNTNRTNINRNELPFVSERSHRPTLNHFHSLQLWNNTSVSIDFSTIFNLSPPDSSKLLPNQKIPKFNPPN